MRSSLLLILILLIGTPCVSKGVWAQADKTRVHEIRVHDPVMIEYEDTYYLYSTGRGISVWRSDEMDEWERVEQVFLEAPVWSQDVVSDFSNHIWAPDIVEHNGTFYLYYSVSSFGRNTSAIGVATNTTLNPGEPEYEWVDHGSVVESVPGRDLWNAIDPNLVFDDDGTAWLAFGSFWAGIKMVRLRDNLIEVEEGEEGEWYTIAALERSFGHADEEAGDAPIEAPFIFKRGDYYYLFVSFGYCCRGEESTYRLAVGRSKEVQGPYLDRDGQEMRYGGGTLVAEGNERWAGVGHNSAYTFSGVDYLVYHGYDVHEGGRATLIVSVINWDDEGWPHVSLE